MTRPLSTPTAPLAARVTIIGACVLAMCSVAYWPGMTELWISGIAGKVGVMALGLAVYLVTAMVAGIAFYKATGGRYPSRP